MNTASGVSRVMTGVGGRRAVNERPNANNEPPGQMVQRVNTAYFTRWFILTADFSH